MQKRVLASGLLAVTTGCASTPAPREPEEVRAALDAVRDRAPYLAMVPEAEARDAMPGYRGRAVPNLARVAAQMPKTWGAEMEAWAALRDEGTLPPGLLGQVFFVVSNANDCFY